MSHAVFRTYALFRILLSLLGSTCRESNASKELTGYEGEAEEQTHTHTHQGCFCTTWGLHKEKVSGLPLASWPGLPNCSSSPAGLCSQCLNSTSAMD